MLFHCLQNDYLMEKRKNYFFQNVTRDNISLQVSKQNNENEM